MEICRMKNRCDSFLKKECRMPDDARILLAVSGGVDSMTMLDLMKGLSYPLGVAHCNFQLRGKASDEDENLVRRQAERLGLPFYGIRFPTKTYANTHKLSIEMAARELRYDWFRQIAATHHYTHIATAHHQDDAQETFFLNLTRGTGIKGLHGILPRNGDLIRPMLAFSREEIEAYARQHHLVFHEDESNREDRFQRNYIRHHVLPVFRSRFPAFDRKMTQSMEVLRMQEVVYQDYIRRLREEIVAEESVGFRIPLRPLSRLPHPSAFLYEVLHPYGFNLVQIQDMLEEGTHQKGKKWIGDNHWVWLTGEALLLRPAEQPPVSVELTYETVDMQAFQGFSPDCHRAYFDAEKIQEPLQIRYWQEGDYFFPLGMQGRKKLSDFFNDLKTDGFQKRQIPLLCNGNGDILWVIGYRSDNRYRVCETTRYVLIAKKKQT